MGRLIGWRLLAALPGVIGVVIVSFVLTRALPGDPAAYFAGPAATQQAIAEIRHSLGLDRSLPEQFVTYVGDLAHGRLGNSLSTGQPVITELLTRLPASIELTVLALLLSVAIAVPLGITAAPAAQFLDRPSLPHCSDGRGQPADLLHRPAAGVRLLLSAGLGAGAARTPRSRLFAAAGTHRLLSRRQPACRRRATALAALRQIALPALTLAIFTLAPIARMTRAAMLSVLSSDFIRAARANGLARRSIVYVYAFRNAMLPVLTTLGMVFSFLLGANVLVEKVFAWPGIGSYAIEALIASDYAPVQGFVLAMALVYILLNLLIDILYGLIDPRAAVTA